MESTAAKTASSSGRGQARILSALAFAFPLLVYLPSAGHFFFPEDDLLNLYRAQRSSLWSLFTPSEAHFIIGYYRPLWIVTYRLTWMAFGESPVAFHLINLLFHAGSAWLVYRLVLRATLSPLAALCGAFVLGLHPRAHVTVMWIATQMDLAAVFFSLVAFGAFLAWRQGRAGIGALVGSWIALALGALYKEIAYAAVAAIGITALLPPPRSTTSPAPPPSRTRALLAVAPFVAMGVGQLVFLEGTFAGALVHGNAATGSQPLVATLARHLPVLARELLFLDRFLSVTGPAAAPALLAGLLAALAGGILAAAAWLGGRRALAALGWAAAGLVIAGAAGPDWRHLYGSLAGAGLLAGLAFGRLQRLAGERPWARPAAALGMLLLFGAATVELTDRVRSFRAPLERARTIFAGLRETLGGTRVGADFGFVNLDLSFQPYLVYLLGWEESHRVASAHFLERGDVSFGPEGAAAALRDRRNRGEHRRWSLVRGGRLLPLEDPADLEPGGRLLEGRRLVPELWYATSVLPVASPTAAWRVIHTGRDDLAETAVVEGLGSIPPSWRRDPEAPLPRVLSSGRSTRVLEGHADPVRTRVVEVDGPGGVLTWFHPYLPIPDVYGILLHPEQTDRLWRMLEQSLPVRLDGAPAPGLRTDFFFRAVAVPPGRHRVEFLLLERP